MILRYECDSPRYNLKHSHPSRFKLNIHASGLTAHACTDLHPQSYTCITGRFVVGTLLSAPCYRPQRQMAPQIPKLWLLAIASGTLAFSQPLIFPEYLSRISATKLFLIYMGVSTWLLVFWKTFIYSKWISPLRHLPQPKVSNLFLPKLICNVF
jgi:hypothetical protein